MKAWANQVKSIVKLFSGGGKGEQETGATGG